MKPSKRKSATVDEQETKKKKQAKYISNQRTNKNSDNLPENANTSNLGIQIPAPSTSSHDQHIDDEVDSDDERSPLSFDNALQRHLQQVLPGKFLKITTNTMISSRQLSIKINEVLNHACVNDEMIKDRRNCFLQLECFDTVLSRTSSQPLYFVDNFYFGSQSEGTTTLGLKSDIDLVNILNTVVVISDKKDGIVSEDMYKFRMEKFTNKGYCCLRDISYFKKEYADDMLQTVFPKEDRRDNYLKNSFSIFEKIPEVKIEREGPAVYSQGDGMDFNYLTGFYCTAWPLEVSKTFLLNQENLHWPSDQLLQDVLQSRCFVVPKGSDTGPDSDIEWRLSLSCGERLLMFDLNIVQIRCYVLMKYIRNTFLDNLQDCKGIISSYICKTVLFHTVSQTQKSEWVEERLFLNFIKCLSNLYKFIDQKNCPHFIMPLNNLLENKLNEATQSRLLEELQRIIESDGHGLLDIKIDDFGELLNRRDIFNNLERKDTIYHFLLKGMTSRMLKFYNLNTGDFYESVQACEARIKMLHELYHSTPVSDEKMHHAITIYVGMYSTLIGSLLASDDIKYRHDLSDKAFQWFLLGMMRTDYASAHLKLASILFMIGDFDSTFTLMDHMEKKFNDNPNVYTCICKIGPLISLAVPELQSQCILKKPCTDIIRDNVINCVVYSLGEFHCCPKELQYEFFRAAFNENSLRDRLDFLWFNCAIIPQVPYRLFLQYKLYKQHTMEEKCYQALEELTQVPNAKELYLDHLETVYNLIGQCMEQEGRFYLALYYYYKSLQVVPTYNAAKILICLNLFTRSPGGMS